MKILYAAGDSSNSKICLERFHNVISNNEKLNNNLLIKYSVFKKSKPYFDIDWCLDCLFDIQRPDHFKLSDNDNLSIYYDQVKYFNPDLIISDLEFFSSYIGGVLNIPVWQCSSSLLNEGLQKTEKYNIGFHKKYSFLYNKKTDTKNVIINSILNSENNFVYSHFGDIDTPPKLKSNFQWIRPYFLVGKKNKLCSHNIVAALSNFTNKKIFEELYHKDDTIIFSLFKEEFGNFQIKSIYDYQEYICNLYNSNYYITQGQSNFLADAYYNGKYSFIYPDFNDIECLANSMFSEKFKFAKCIYDFNKELNNEIINTNTC